MDITFYQDAKNKILKLDLFSKTAEDLAKNFSAEKGKNRRSQVRKFYDEVLRLNSLAKSRPGDWRNIHPYVEMLIAKATYAEGRELVSENFATFMRKAVTQVQVPQDLEVFANFFEAFMGFYRKYQKAN